eukprot:403342724
MIPLKSHEKTKNKIQMIQTNDHINSKSKSHSKKPPSVQKNFSIQVQQQLNNQGYVHRYPTSPSEICKTEASPYISKPSSGFITQNQSVDVTQRKNQVLNPQIWKTNTSAAAQFIPDQVQQQYQKELNSLNRIDPQQLLQNQRKQSKSSERGQQVHQFGTHDQNQRQLSRETSHQSFLTQQQYQQQFGTQNNARDQSQNRLEITKHDPPNILSNRQVQNQTMESMHDLQMKLQQRSKIKERTRHKNKHELRQQFSETQPNLQDIGRYAREDNQQQLNLVLGTQPTQQQHTFRQLIAPEEQKRLKRDYSQIIQNLNLQNITSNITSNNINTTADSIQNTINLIPISQTQLQTITNDDKKHSKVNVKKFVKHVISRQLADLTKKDPIFKEALDPFIMEGTTLFTQNSEKHYRIKFVMDLVKALSKSIQIYTSQNHTPNNAYHTQGINIYDQERVKLQQERDKLAQKIQKFQECEDDFKKRICEFENVFSKLTDVKSNFESEKKFQLVNHLQKYRELESEISQKNQKLSLSIERESIVIEDQRSRLMRDFEKHKLINDDQRKLLKLDQLKLQDDIREFLALRDHFEQYKQSKIEQIQNMKSNIERDLNDRDCFLRTKEEKLFQWEESLKSQEKAITQILLNNNEDLYRDDTNLLKSCTISSSNTDLALTDTNTLSQPQISNFFDQFMGQFKQNADEMHEREKMLSQFLKRHDPTRASLQSILHNTNGSSTQALGGLLNLESLRSSMQANPMELTRRSLEDMHKFVSKNGRDINKNNIK